MEYANISHPQDPSQLVYDQRVSPYRIGENSSSVSSKCGTTTNSNISSDRPLTSVMCAGDPSCNRAVRRLGRRISMECAPYETLYAEFLNLAAPDVHRRPRFSVPIRVIFPTMSHRLMQSSSAAVAPVCTNRMTGSRLCCQSCVAHLRVTCRPGNLFRASSGRSSDGRRRRPLDHRVESRCTELRGS